MRQFHSILSLTATMTATCAAGALVGFNDTPITTDDQPVKGVAQHPATEVGLDIAVTAIGTETVTAVGAITRGARLISTAGGVKVAPANAVNAFAYALTDAPTGTAVQIIIR